MQGAVVGALSGAAMAVANKLRSARGRRQLAAGVYGLSDGHLNRLLRAILPEDQGAAACAELSRAGKAQLVLAHFRLTPAALYSEVARMAASQSAIAGAHGAARSMVVASVAHAVGSQLGRRLAGPATVAVAAGLDMARDVAAYVRGNMQQGELAQRGAGHLVRGAGSAVGATAGMVLGAFAGPYAVVASPVCSVAGALVGEWASGRGYAAALVRAHALRERRLRRQLVDAQLASAAAADSEADVAAKGAATDEAAVDGAELALEQVEVALEEAAARADDVQSTPWLGLASGAGVAAPHDQLSVLVALLPPSALVTYLEDRGIDAADAWVAAVVGEAGSRAAASPLPAADDRCETRDAAAADGALACCDAAPAAACTAPQALAASDAAASCTVAEEAAVHALEWMSAPAVQARMLSLLADVALRQLRADGRCTIPRAVLQTMSAHRLRSLLEDCDALPPASATQAQLVDLAAREFADAAAPRAPAGPAGEQRPSPLQPWLAPAPASGGVAAAHRVPPELHAWPAATADAAFAPPVAAGGLAGPLLLVPSAVALLQAGEAARCSGAVLCVQRGEGTVVEAEAWAAARLGAAALVVANCVGDGEPRRAVPARVPVPCVWLSSRHAARLLAAARAAGLPARVHISPPFGRGQHTTLSHAARALTQGPERLRGSGLRVTSWLRRHASCVVTGVAVARWLLAHNVVHTAEEARAAATALVRARVLQPLQEPAGSSEGPGAPAASETGAAVPGDEVAALGADRLYLLEADEGKWETGHAGEPVVALPEAGAQAPYALSPAQWGEAVPPGGVTAALATDAAAARGAVLVLWQRAADGEHEPPLHAQCMQAALAGAVAVIVVADDAAEAGDLDDACEPACEPASEPADASEQRQQLEARAQQASAALLSGDPLVAVPVAMAGQDAVPALHESVGQPAVLTARAGLWLRGDRLRFCSAAAGDAFSVVLTARGAALAFGLAVGGRLGLGAGDRGAEWTDRLRPTLVPGLATLGATHVAAAETACFAITLDGRLMAWGRNGRTHAAPEATPTDASPAPSGTATPASTALVAAGTPVTPAGSAPGRTGALLQLASAVAASGGDGTPLGFGSEDTWDRLAPCEVAPLRGVPMAHVAASGNHVLAVAADGRVFAWGRGKHGKLGLGDLRDRATPTALPVDAFPARPVAAAAADGHSFIVCADGALLAFGRAGERLGLGALDAAPAAAPATCVAVPTRVQALAGHMVVGVATTADNAFAWTCEGALFAWGRNRAPGVLGMGDAAPRAEPTRVQALSDVRVVQVAVGEALPMRTAQFAVALSADGAAYSWGSGANGVLGHGDSKSVAEPTRIAALEGVRVVHMAAGSAHALACSADGELHAWGRGKFGRLGLGHEQEERLPQRVEWTTVDLL